MQVVLLQRVEKLGQMGQVVSVKDGYARNFLIPQKRALRATKENIAHFEAQRATLEAHNLKLKKDAEQLAKKVDGAMVSVIRQAGESGQLYGSVSARDIVEALENDRGLKIARSQVADRQPIKTIGIHDVRVDLHPEVHVTVRVNVALSEEEAQVQAEAERAEKA